MILLIIFKIIYDLFKKLLKIKIKIIFYYFFYMYKFDI